MREIRMTFGEHLDELRTRILISLIYLALGVGLAFGFGDTLLQLVLRPHEKAFSGALRVRELRGFNKGLDDLETLRSGNPAGPTKSGRRLVPDGFRWEALFPDEVARARIRQRIGGPIDVALGQVNASQVDAATKLQLQNMLTMNRTVAESLIQEVATDFRFSGSASIPERLRTVEKKLRTLSERESHGLGELKKSIGWGEDLETPVERLKELNDFLDGLKVQIATSTVSLVELRDLTNNLELVDGLTDLLESFERSTERLTSQEPKKILVLDYMEHFSAYLKVAVIFGLFLSIPLILYEMWKFVGAGLHPHEQKYVVTFMPFSLVLFMCGAFFGYQVLIPVGLEFLASWGSTEVDMNFALGNYVGLFMTLTLILGVVFQTPLVMVFIYKIGIVDVSVFRKARRISIFMGVFLAVILTPPDPFSWCLMAIPMILLYELGIIICQFMGPNQAPEESDESEDAAA